MPLRSALAALSVLAVAFASAARGVDRRASAPPLRSGGEPVAWTPPPEILRFAWGAAPTQLGRLPAHESSPECPSSFIVDGRGSPTFLDQVNDRLLTIDDTGPRPLALDHAAWGDVEAGVAGGAALLDRKRGVVRFVDVAGRTVSEVEATSDQAPVAGGLTALVRSVDGYWAEYDHDRSTLVATLDGRPVLRGPTHPGTPARGSTSRVRAVVAADRLSVRVEVWPAPGKPAQVRTLRFPSLVMQVQALEADASQVVLAVRLFPAYGSPAGTPTEQHVVAMAPDLSERWRRRWGWENNADEQLRPVRLGADGKVYTLTCTDAGAIVRRLP